MVFHVLGEINWLAVVLGGLVYFVLGAVWYLPLLFSGPWQRSIGWDAERTPPEMNPVTYLFPPCWRTSSWRRRSRGWRQVWVLTRWPKGSCSGWPSASASP